MNLEFNLLILTKKLFIAIKSFLGIILNNEIYLNSPINSNHLFKSNSSALILSDRFNFLNICSIRFLSNPQILNKFEDSFLRFSANPDLIILRNLLARFLSIFDLSLK